MYCGFTSRILQLNYKILFIRETSMFDQSMNIHVLELVRVPHRRLHADLLTETCEQHY